MSIFQKPDPDYIEHRRAHNLKYMTIFSIAALLLYIGIWAENEVPMFPIRFSGELDYYFVSCVCSFTMFGAVCLLILSRYQTKLQDTAIWLSILVHFSYTNIMSYIEVSNEHGFSALSTSYIAMAVVISMRIPIFVTIYIASGIGFYLAIMALNMPDSSTYKMATSSIIIISALVFITVERQRQKVFESQKKLAGKVKELNKALDVKSVFFGQIIHELRTPLNAIIGFSEMVMSKNYQPKTIEKITEYMGFINSSGNHLLKLVNDILDTTKIEAEEVNVRLEKIDLGKTLQKHIDQLGSISKGNGQQISLIMEEEISLNTDRRLLKQIMYNLISNAQKFTPEGGLIEIRAKHAERGCINIIIKDSGKGMESEMLNEVNEASTSMDTNFITRAEGTGFGLIIVRQLVQLLQGTINFKSEPGKGTEITMSFPDTL